MSTDEERVYYVPTRQQHGSGNMYLKFAFAASIIIASLIGGLFAMRYIDTRMPARTETSATPAPTIPLPPTTDRNGNMGGAPAVVPTANIPAVQQVQFEPAPPASVPIEDVQPRVEVINVQRAPEQTTITRTVPNKPSGPPIVIDKGVKQRGAPRP